MAKQHHCVDPNQSIDVGPRFSDLQPLGFGGGGQVYSAVDVECDKYVAIKIIGLSDPKSCKVALRETRILRKLQHENIVKIHDVLYPSGGDDENDEPTQRAPSVYIVQELLDTDLRHVINSGTLTNEHARLFMYQLLRGIKYLHSANVLHRDLKPDNLLINMDDLVLKIGDFGMARIIDPDYSHKGHLTQNVCTRWYRSPELIFCPTDYTKSIDMWSAGCIFAEMLSGKPLFPGDHDLEQMLLILEMIPVREADLAEVQDSIPKKMLKNYKGSPRIALCDVFSTIELDALDILQAMLTFNSHDRVTADEAINLPYLKIYSCASDEPQEQQPFHVEYEVDNLSPVTLRKMIFSECVRNGSADVENRLKPDLFSTHDSDDGYEWKLEMLSLSSRDNSDLDSAEELDEKLDSGKSPGPPGGGGDNNGNNEKSESESSEKSAEDSSKENKLALWDQEIAARTSSSEVIQEKGATESDGEPGEKSESEDSKSEKETSALPADSTESPFEKNVPGSSPKPDKNAPLKTVASNQKQEKRELKMDVPAKEDDPHSDLSEKSIDDKLQKEKTEDIPGEGVHRTPKHSHTGQSVRRKEREDAHASHQLVNNKVLYDEEKSLRKCLEISCQLEAKSPVKSKLASNGIDFSQEVHNLGSTVVPLSAATSSSNIREHPNSRIHVPSPSLVHESGPFSRATSIDEVLFVDIPQNAGSQTTWSPCSSPPREGDKSIATVYSPRSRGSNSPREKSVRPKKQDWFYMHKGSNH